MAQTSVAQFASELKVPPSVLLEQLRAAGVDKHVPEVRVTVAHGQMHSFAGALIQLLKMRQAGRANVELPSRGLSQ